MTFRLGFTVRQIYGDDAPEIFGTEMFDSDRVPKPGDVIMLHWLDGSDAYRARVLRITEDMRMDVETMASEEP